MDGLREELVDATNRYTWKTKARLMKQHVEGHMSSWTPEADVFLEVFSTTKDLLPDGVNATNVAATDDSSINEVVIEDA